MALMQLGAYGAQDKYLTGNPVTSFFKQKIQQHTNFADENIEIPIKTPKKLICNCNINQSKNNKFCPNCGKSLSLNKNNMKKVNFEKKNTIIIPRNGDLIHKIYVKIKITGDNNNENFIPKLGENIIKLFKIFIGEQLISSYDNDYMKIYNYINKNSDDYDLYNNLIGLNEGIIIIPLLFWFCKEPNLALPLIALRYHDVKIELDFESIDNIYHGVKDIQVSYSLMVDFIWLESKERRWMSQTSHEYLIEQIQMNEYPITKVDEIYRLYFNHCCKELLWVTKKDNKYINNLTSINIQFNGQNRVKQNDPLYYNKIQPYQYNRRNMKGVYNYSFSLYPQKNLNPSGSCNFSRLDNIRLICKNKQIENSTIKIYCVSYNILRIQSGMGGMAFSN